jgi:hypothetical protein
MRGIIATLAFAVGLACAGCGTDAVTRAPATRSSPVDVAQATTDEGDDIRIAAYRFELALHAYDADREEFGGFFLDYPEQHEPLFLAAFARQVPPIRAKRWCRVCDGGIIDAMTGKPGLSFVAEIKTVEKNRAVVAMSWYGDPDSGAGTMLGLERTAGEWRVDSCTLMWAR